MSRVIHRPPASSKPEEPQASRHGVNKESSGDVWRSASARQPTPPKGTTKWGLLKALGPGLTTGASDDDPSGIATYSQVGAQFGFGMLWVMLFSYPLMGGIQEISGVIGRVTGHGIAGNLRRHFHPALLYVIVLLVLIANVINIGADLAAMGEAGALLLGGVPASLYAALLAVVVVLLEVFLPYDRYTAFLKWLCLVVFAYVATAFVVHIPWGTALRHTLLPSVSSSATFITSLVAVLGTTISPYLFFWQAEEEVEIIETNPREEPLKRAPRQARRQLQRIRVDTYLGMAISNVVAFFIILTAGATLHPRGITDIHSAAEAAKALEPIAGRFAEALFGLGIIGTGLLAVPVLAGSAAYAVGEALRWPVGLNRDLLHARGFYAVIAAATLLGLGMCFIHVDPIKALFWSAVLNGVVAPPIMLLMMRMAQDPKVMGRQFTLNARQKALGWLATAVMIAAAVGLFATWGKG